jgi:hypothetical protein
MQVAPAHLMVRFFDLNGYKKYTERKEMNTLG